MAYKFFDDFSSDFTQKNDGEIRVSALSDDGTIALPDESFIRDADMSRDGIDLVLQTDDGTIIIEGYFAIEPTPNLTAPNGTTLTPDLVNSFTHGGNEYASAEIQTNDSSPVGAVQEISGNATVTRLNGTVENVGIGTPIYQGDIIETDEEGAVNIMFVDETTFAVSEDARLAIDEYVFDPATQSGTSNFSVLKGVFVFTSGLIGRDDPDDVMIDTPSGSIGIRGTIIAGDVNSGEITVIEGAIVLTDFSGNSVTLANQYETAKFNPSESTIEPMGTLGAEEVSSKFMSVSTVAADLFSSINDSANDNGASNNQEATSSDQAAEEKQGTTTNEPEKSDAAPEAPATPQDGEGSATDASLEGATTEIITSDDITGKATPTAESKIQTTISGNEPTGTNTQTAEPTGTNTPAPPPKIAPQPETPFSISVQKFAVNENASDVNVAHVKGNFTEHTNLSLVGPANNFYEIQRVDENNLIIKLKSGVNIDAERPFPLTISASNAAGGAIITSKIDVDVRNTYDDPTQFIGSLPNNSGNADNAFIGSEETEFRYNFGKDFFDADGDIASYQFNPGTIPGGVNTGSISFDTTTGFLSFDLNPTVTNGSFTFTINAQDSGGSTIGTQTFTYDIYNPTQTYTSGTPLFTPGTYVTTDDIADINIAGGGIRVISDEQDAQSTYTLNSNNNQIKAGGGEDTIEFGAGTNNNYAFGDSGNDQFDMNSITNYAYGGEGNDRFHVYSNGEVTTLESASTGIMMDGGHGDNDTFHLSTGGNIDFTAINDGFIKNIERLGMIDGGGTGQVISISYTDVVAMTDANNTIKIDMDADDTLNFTNNNGNGYDFYLVNSTAEYDTYTDGIVTLLVDADTTNVTGIV